MQIHCHPRIIVVFIFGALYLENFEFEIFFLVFLNFISVKK